MAVNAEDSPGNAPRAPQKAGDAAVHEESSVPQWHINGAKNQKEALGFLKDWVSAVLSIQTTLIGAIAVFVGIKGVSDF